MRSSARATVVLSWLALTSVACDPILGPSRPDANWTVHGLGRFTLYTRPGSFAEQHVATFVSVLEDQFDTTVSRLGLHYDGRITMFLHSSGADAGFRDDRGGGDHSGVAYPETETVKVAVVPPLDANLFSLLSHEANHVIIRNGLGRAGTTFMNEGLASAVLSERHHPLGRTFYYRWTADRRGQLPRLRQLVNDDEWPSVDQSVAYSTSASFLAYVLEVYNPGPLRAIYYATSSGFSQAFETAYGQSLETAEAAWLTFCEQRAR
jgi:hypothetical protein